MPSYTGNDIAHKPARMKRGEELHRRLYDKLGGRPLTLEETHAPRRSFRTDAVRDLPPRTSSV